MWHMMTLFFYSVLRLNRYGMLRFYPNTGGKTMNNEKDDRIIIEHLHVQQIHRTAKIDLWFNRILGLLSFITLVVAIIYFATVLILL
jgi:hypothetical protein